ncbi:cellulase family glycosylhydrolase [Chryseolinea sp. H1M3-3]|uniref:cellulase family glycosylhydrolase n=1 Tax=Chryseolinea sp. H1M3-3 TaxID=3034144 RepID=UPI0023ED91A8|nr:cellulase family glycosylhydrolase [Chryseolinea sp. H1M3-3]
MKCYIQWWLITIVLSACNQPAQRKPIALHPENPHYFIYDGKPTILITSAEHYGAVLNLDFDYVKYLDALSKSELNLTRTFTGVYVEPVGAFEIERNTLAPAPQKFICPWARSKTPGYTNGGNKFDLTKWDEAYFTRLKDFMAEAERRNVMVELALFCPFYEDSQWNLSPMNEVNNVNGKGPKDRTHVYTVDKSNGLLEIHEALVRKIVSELKNYSNLIYEICNEPYWGGVTMDWQHHIASVIRDEEKDFSQQHLISQNIANDHLKIENPHPAVSVFNFHYAYPPIAVAQNYHFNKVIGDNETGFDGQADSTYRREGWSFILAGGALYNNLDYSFTADHEDGSFQYPNTQPGGGTPALRKQLSFLRKFIDGFDYLKMKPDSTLIPGDQNKRAYVLSEPGKQYAIYIFGKGPHVFELTVPAGNYTVEFMDPLTGTYAAKQNVASDNKLKLTSPAYPEDLAVKITSAD